MAADDPSDLAASFSASARSLEQQETPALTLIEIVKDAVNLVPGCDEGSISVVLGRRQVSSEAASGELPRVIDAMQEELGQGPCLDAAYKHLAVLVPDMASDDRWPLFAPRAAAAGAASMLSCRLYVEGENLGALNLYARTAGAFDEESEHVALLFASHAAIAYADSRKVERLEGRIATRQLIGQAQGILIERYKITGDAAFVMLVRASQRSNVKLRDVAERLVIEGRLDEG